MSLRSILVLATILATGTAAFAQSADDINSFLKQSSPGRSPPASSPMTAPTAAPPSQDQAAPPPTPTKPMGKVAPTMGGPGARATILGKSELRDIGTDATVFVMIFKGETYAGSGSGFFIAPDLVMTNDHVASAGDRLIVFASDRSRTAGRIFLRSETRAVGDHDFAVLKLEENVGRRIVAFSTAYRSLTDVVAFGFPGKVMDLDRQFADVFKGDQRAIPTITVSTGSINNVLENTQHVEVLTHSAKIAPGNSGGPLFDTCGRVVGINTYEANQKITVAGDKPGSTRAVDVPQGYQWALSGAEIVKFLRSRAIEVPVFADACE